MPLDLTAIVIVCYMYSTIMHGCFLSGDTVPVNYRKGITISSLSYNYDEDILTLNWETSGSYLLSFFTCDQSIKLQSMTISTCSPVRVNGLRNMIGSSTFMIDVEACDEEGVCEFAPPTGARVDVQTLVQIDLSDNSKSLNCHISIAIVIIIAKSLIDVHCGKNLAIQQVAINSLKPCKTAWFILSDGTTIMPVAIYTLKYV